MSGSLTLHEYMAERWSSRSEMVSLVFRTTISIPGSLRWRTSVSVTSGVNDQCYSQGGPRGSGIPPYCLAKFVNPSQSGALAGKSSKFPISGYAFGPGGYGRVFFDRFCSKYHTGNAISGGSTRDMYPELPHMTARLESRAISGAAAAATL